MKVVSGLKLGAIAASVLLLISCAKHSGRADLSDNGLSAQGLGKLSHFAGQVAGESYTTEAPHNQVYLFSYDDSNFAPKYMNSLNAQASYLKSHPGARVLIAGHTDERGSREYNVALGERRANTIAELLRMAGVNADQMRMVSYGKERPANYGHDEDSHRQNRRAEFIYEATQ